MDKQEIVFYATYALYEMVVTKDFNELLISHFSDDPAELEKIRKVMISITKQMKKNAPPPKHLKFLPI